MKKTLVVLLTVSLATICISACGSSAASIDSKAEAEYNAEEDKDVEESSTANGSVTEEVDPCADGHTWKEATCTAPKTCSVCGLTEGDPLEHEWKAATIDSPKTCVNCGATEGDPVICKEIDSSLIDFDKWKLIGLLEDGIFFANPREKDLLIELYDYEGNLVKEFDFAHSHNFGVFYFIDCFCVRIGNKLTFFNMDGESIGEVEFDTDFNDRSFWMGLCNDKEHYVIFDDEEQTNIAYYIDKNTMELIDAKDSDADYDEGETTVPDYDKDVFACLEVVPNMDDRFFVANKDESQWGYVDTDLNVLKMYKDATNYNDKGYAFVSEDGMTYDIIDRDFNIVAKDFIEGSESSAGVSPSLGIRIKTDSGYKYFIVK